MTEMASGKPHPRIQILVDQEQFEFIVFYPGENLPKRHTSVDGVLRELRGKLQAIRYADSLTAVDDEMIAKPSQE